MSRHTFRYELYVMESTQRFDDLRRAGRAYLNVPLDLRPEARIVETKTRGVVTYQAVVAARGTPPTEAELRDWALEDRFDLLKEGA